jgi:hypothetical protein
MGRKRLLERDGRIDRLRLGAGDRQQQDQG